MLRKDLLGGYNQSKIHEAADKDLEVFEYVENISRRYVTLDSSLSLIFLQASANIGFFIACEPTG